MPVVPTRSTSEVRSVLRAGRAVVGLCASAGAKRLKTIAAARRTDSGVRADDFTLKTSVGFFACFLGLKRVCHKREGKRQEAKIKDGDSRGVCLHFCPLPFAPCLLPSLSPSSIMSPF